MEDDKSRMAVNEKERSLVERARDVEKLEERLHKKKIEVAELEEEVRAAYDALHFLLPARQPSTPPSGLPPLE